MRAEVARAREDSGRPFPHSGQLTAARERAREIERQLEEAAKPQQREQPQQSAGAVGGEDIGQTPDAVRISRSAFPGRIRLPDSVETAATQNRHPLSQEHSVRPVR